jgi:hypothetical protein
MKITHNEKGYSLLLTLSVFLLFTIFALSLITFTIAGAKRSQMNEDHIQALELANMGIEYVKQEVTKDLQAQLPIRTENLDKNLKAILSKTEYTSEDLKAPLETGTFHAKIINNDEPGIIDIISTGKDYNGQEKTVTATMDLTATAEADHLRYVVGTHQSNLCNSNFDLQGCEGSGNLFLHGGIDIQGDIHVDENMILHNRGFNGIGFIGNDYPKVSQVGATNESPTIFMDERKIFDFEPFILTDLINIFDLYNRHLTNAPNEFGFFGLQKYRQLDKLRLKEKLKNADLSINNEKRDVPNIEIDNIINKNKQFIQNLPEYKLNNANFTEIDLSYSNNRIYPTNYNNVCVDWSLYPIFCGKYEKEFKFQNKNYKFRYLEVPGHLVINGNRRNVTSLQITGKNNKESAAAFIEKDFIIGLSPTFHDIYLSGIYYIGENLTIAHCRLFADAIMFVNGDVTIDASDIRGIDENSTLLIFASGNINFHADSFIGDYIFNETERLHGFLYSDRQIDITGVKSKVEIIGGISGNKVVLNGYKNISNQSHLKIIYDQNLLDKYKHLMGLQPVIINIHPRIIERKIE